MTAEHERKRPIIQIIQSYPQLEQYLYKSETNKNEL